MKVLNIFLFEWKHFVRSPFKVVALLLFVLAGGYGLHSGANLYQAQRTEIESIQEKVAAIRQERIAYFEEGKTNLEDRPWIDLATPFWAIWMSDIHHFKMPSPALVYSIGQAEQYGFYKEVSFMASPYDADMTQELANPERLQAGNLDFSFALIYLLPLLLLILLYNLKGAEAERGYLPLIAVQIATKTTWLLSRMAFYLVLVFAVLVGLLVYGAVLTGVFGEEGDVFWQMVLLAFVYLNFWAVIDYLILRGGTSIMSNTLKMVGIWLILAFVIPGAVHQSIAIQKPANLMTEMIDASRDESEELYNLPDSIYQAKVDAMFPELAETPVARDSTKKEFAYNRSSYALINELMKNSLQPIEADQEAKNDMVRSSYWFNPISLFQNQCNSLSQSHFDDYQTYRDEIQELIDLQIQTLVHDVWNDVVVDKEKYLDYHRQLSLD